MHFRTVIRSHQIISKRQKGQKVNIKVERNNKGLPQTHRLS